jgi:hypothetical protein
LANLSRWESPKVLALIVAGTAALFGTLAGIAGYDMAHAPPPAGLTIIFQAGAIQVMPAAPPPERRP